MKDIKYIIIALAVGLLSSCMHEFNMQPKFAESPYGNNSIVEQNVLTIEQLKAKYSSEINNSLMTEIKEDIQIKGIVTGNDIAGNLYNQFALQDTTGALLISVTQGGQYGYLPVGQEILVSLKGLIIGGYGSQTQVGGIYVNSNTGAQSVGRMNRYVWNSHYKLLATHQPDTIAPMEFDKTKLTDKQYIANHCGKLMTLKNVRLKEADGKAVFAPDDGTVNLTANAANRSITGMSTSRIVVRTSTFANFANIVMPTEEVDITGIFTRYRDTWQILLRSANDIHPSVKQ